MFTQLLERIDPTITAVASLLIAGSLILIGLLAPRRGEKVLDGSVADVKRNAGTRNVALGLSGGAHNGVTEVLRDTQMVRKVDDTNNYFELELAPDADAQVLLRRLVDAFNGMAA